MALKGLILKQQSAMLHHQLIDRPACAQKDGAQHRDGYRQDDQKPTSECSKGAVGRASSAPGSASVLDCSVGPEVLSIELLIPSRTIIREWRTRLPRWPWFWRAPGGSSIICSFSRE